MPKAFPAAMGFIGSVQIENLPIVRATSCSLNAKQAINHPDVIDGGIDWTLYQLGGVEVDGDVAVPVVGDPGFVSGLLGLLRRNPSSSGDGYFTNSLGSKIVVSYGNALVRVYSGCQPNTMEFRATAGERLDATANFMGTHMDPSGPSSGTPAGIFRVLSWADLTVTGASGVVPCDIKAFTLTINNNLARNYTFCAEDGYYPNNISAGKRNVSGNLEFQGPAPTDPLALNNMTTTTPPGGNLVFGFGNLATITCYNITYEFQGIEAQPALITSTVNWYAHAAAGDEAITF
jgi:hypothetical protein